MKIDEIDHFIQHFSDDNNLYTDGAIKELGIYELDEIRCELKLFNKNLNRLITAINKGVEQLTDAEFILD